MGSLITNQLLIIYKQDSGIRWNGMESDYKKIKIVLELKGLDKTQIW